MTPGWLQHRRPVQRPPWFLLAAAVGVVAASLLPLGYLIMRTARAGGSQVWHILRQPRTLLGETNFLPGQAGQGQVTCELGRFPTTGIHTGPVEVMLRPETVQLIPNDTGPAEVVERTYFGHDQLVQVQLASGTRLQSRLLGPAGEFYPGQRVELKVGDGVVVYPARTD